MKMRRVCPASPFLVSPASPFPVSPASPFPVSPALPFSVFPVSPFPASPFPPAPVPPAPAASSAPAFPFAVSPASSFLVLGDARVLIFKRGIVNLTTGHGVNEMRPVRPRSAILPKFSPTKITPQNGETRAGAAARWCLAAAS